MSSITRCFFSLILVVLNVLTLSFNSIFVSFVFLKAPSPWFEEMFSPHQRQSFPLVVSVFSPLTLSEDLYSPVMSNHSRCRCDSIMMTPTMLVTGSVSKTAKVKCGSSNVMGSVEGCGMAIHSMSSRVVEERGGLPPSVALI